MAVSLLTIVFLLSGCKSSGLIAAAALGGLAGGAEAMGEKSRREAALVRGSFGSDVDCSELQGASVVAHGGIFLGTLTSEYNSDSVLNEYGKYGSDYSNTSIWNDYSKYGGQLSALSPFNDLAANPPFIVRGGRAIGRLTVDEFATGSVNPYLIKSCDF